MLTFDWTINLGHLIQIGALVGAALYFSLVMRNDINVVRREVLYVEEKLEELGKAFAQLGNLLTQITVQETRMIMIEKCIDELRHGQGYIIPVKT